MVSELDCILAYRETVAVKSCCDLTSQLCHSHCPYLSRALIFLLCMLSLRVPIGKLGQYYGCSSLPSDVLHKHNSLQETLHSFIMPI